jgi:hypothetical protein
MDEYINIIWRLARQVGVLQYSAFQCFVNFFIAGEFVNFLILAEPVWLDLACVW